MVHVVLYISEPSGRAYVECIFDTVEKAKAHVMYKANPNNYIIESWEVL